MYADWIDPSLFLHAMGSFVLAVMIARTAWKKHRRRMWGWPLALFTIWFLKEGVEGLTFMRRLLSRVSGHHFWDYGGAFSFVLNHIGWILTFALAYRIYRGDIDD